MLTTLSHGISRLPPSCSWHCPLYPDPGRLLPQRSPPSLPRFLNDTPSRTISQSYLSIFLHDLCLKMNWIHRFHFIVYSCCRPQSRPFQLYDCEILLGARIPCICLISVIGIYAVLMGYSVINYNVKFKSHVSIFCDQSVRQSH